MISSLLGPKRSALACTLLTLLGACGPTAAGVASLTGAAALGVMETVVSSYSTGGGYSGANGEMAKLAVLSFYSGAHASCNESSIDKVADLTITLSDAQLAPGNIPLVGFIEKYPLAVPLATFGIERHASGGLGGLSTTNGTLTLTATGSHHLQGTLAAVMEDAQGHSGTVTAQFDAPACAALW